MPEKIKKMKEDALKKIHGDNPSPYDIERAEKDYELRQVEVAKYIPDRYKGVSIQDIPKQVLDAMPSSDTKNGLYIWGGVGAGKTHILYALKMLWGYQLRSLKVVNVSEMLNDIKKSFGTQQPEDILEDYTYGKKFVAYDDLGAEKGSEWAGEQIYRLVNYLYESKCPFIFTSNLSLQELAGRFGEIQGDRIASRIAEMANIVELKEKDRRI